MDLITLANKLDIEFKIQTNEENLNDFAVTIENRKYINPEFVSRKTALMTNNTKRVDIVLTAVFITAEVVEKALDYSNALIVTHHNFNYFEDERGLQPIDNSFFEKLKQNNISIYVAHAPLDTHSVFGTSKSLAELCEIKIQKYFYNYFGAPTALTGETNVALFDDFANKVKEKLGRPILTIEKYTDTVHRIAIIAGGGDMSDILQQAYDLGCDTLLTGTVEHRWGVPFIQEENKRFHKLNKQLKLNLIGGTHFGTERPAMLNLLKLFDQIGINNEYIEDYNLLNVL